VKKLSKRSVIFIGIVIVVLALAIVIGSTIFNVPPLNLSGAAGYAFTGATAIPTSAPTATSTPETIIEYSIIQQKWTSSGQTISSTWKVHQNFSYQFSTVVPHGCTIVSDDPSRFQVSVYQVIADDQGVSDTVHGLFFANALGNTTIYTQCPSTISDTIIVTIANDTNSGFIKLQTEYIASPLKVKISF